MCLKIVILKLYHAILSLILMVKAFFNFFNCRHFWMIKKSSNRNKIGFMFKSRKTTL